MRFAAIPLLLLCAGLGESLVVGESLRRWRTEGEWRRIQKHFDVVQRPLQQIKIVPDVLATSTKPEDHTRPFDASENSVGLLLTTSAGNVVHLWMPLGRRVFARDSPNLPLRPESARITTLINSSPRLATPEQLERIQCDVWTANNRTEGRARGRREKWKVSFSKKDGLVKFSDHEGPARRWWLGNKEVESFKCS